MAITVTMLLLYTVVFSLTTTDADIMRGSPKNSNVYVKEFRHRSITLVLIDLFYLCKQA